MIETQRGFAKWELADYIVIKGGAEVKSSTPGQEETIAETMDKKGEVIGRWVVKWGENGEGKCQQIGKVVRCVHIAHLNSILKCIPRATGTLTCMKNCCINSIRKLFAAYLPLEHNQVR